MDIARRLIEQQRGEITAVNRPDGGSLVRVTLATAARSAA